VCPRAGGGYRIRNEAGVCEDVDAVVFAAPPPVTGPLLSAIPELAGAADVLERFEYFSSEISIHRDPVYMPSKPRFWSAYNANAEGDHCEASIWYGALRPPVAGQAALPLFKSWATARSAPPQDEVFRRAFRHPLITPDFIRAQQDLEPYQGQAGVWFAGSYTREVDSQETALTSAMRIVAELDPRRRTCSPFQTSPAQGLDDLGWDRRTCRSVAEDEAQHLAGRLPRRPPESPRSANMVPRCL
jgi:predicted NAD/FAD-binding protein